MGQAKPKPCSLLTHQYFMDQMKNFCLGALNIIMEELGIKNIAYLLQLLVVHVNRVLSYLSFVKISYIFLHPISQPLPLLCVLCVFFSFVSNLLDLVRPFLDLVRPNPLFTLLSVSEFSDIEFRHHFSSFSSNSSSPSLSIPPELF